MFYKTGTLKKPVTADKRFLYYLIKSKRNNNEDYKIKT